MAKKAKKKPEKTLEVEKQVEVVEVAEKPKKNLGKLGRTPAEQKKADKSINKMYKLQLKLNGGIKMTPEDWTEKK